MYRFLFNEDGGIDPASEVLDEKGIPYDFDSGDRIMISGNYAKEAMAAWDEAGIDYEEI